MREEFQANRLFAGVSRERLAGVEVTVKDATFAPGDLLFAEDSPGRHVFLLCEGEVAISKSGRGGEEEVLGIAGPGEFVGEMAIIDGGERSARATAVARTRAGAIKAEDLLRLLDTFPVIALNVGRTAIERLRQTDQTFIEKLLESERLSLIGRMMGSIVHDFRNPIAIVLQATHYLKNRTEDPIIPRMAGIIEESVERMLAMTRELLDFSRGATRIELQEESVPALLDAIENECRPGLAARGVDLALDSGYSGTIAVDRHRFQRLLQNIIKNAEEAMPDGGRLLIAAESAGDQILFHISDTGCGMPAEIAARVFESFVTHGKTEGTGLGLSIAKAIVDAHGGRIWVESAPGKGTTFHIALPTTQPVGS